MRKLIIQIPCLNEEQTIAYTLSRLPRQMDGFDSIEWLIIDDGCTDNTVQIARKNGADHVVSFPNNKGLAKGFMAGLDASVKLGAHVVVNTDADSQYNAEDIPKLVKPILAGNAEIVIGERPISATKHFSPVKKALQKLGSFVVRSVSKTDIPDAPSGFRAFSREAAMRMNVFNDYTYTLETIIQAGQKKMAITSVPIRTNEQLRPSRLFKNMYSYVAKSLITILRIFVVYKPFRFFMIIGSTLFTSGFLIGLRFLYFLSIGEGQGHVQSVILSGVLIIVGFQTALVAFLAELLAVNRIILEDIQYRTKISCGPLEVTSSNAFNEK